MEWILELLEQAGRAAGAMLLQPYYYAAVLFIALLVQRQVRTERRLFHVRLTMWPRVIGPSLAAGAAVGAAVSAAFLFLGVRLTADAVYWLWGASLLLFLLRIRWLGYVYAAGLLGIVQWALGFFEWDAAPELFAKLEGSLADVDTGGLLLLAGVLQLAEAVLMRWRGSRQPGATFVEGKRGRLVGGYQLQSYWPVPLLLLVPGHADAALPWVPLLWQDGAPGGWGMLGLPLILGLGAMTTSLLPQYKARRMAGLLLWTGVGATAAGTAAALWEPLVPVAAIVAPILHEIIHFMERRREEESSPLYVHDDRGLRVLAVTPNTPASQLGVEPGEILHKVNGIRVRTMEDLYNGLLVNSAFSKLEVYNLEGQIKFLQRARFEGEHHQLGFVFAPDEATLRLTEGAPASLLDLLRRGSKSRKREAGREHPVSS